MTVTSSADTAARPERFYTVPEAALLLKVSALTVRRAIHAGELAATRLRRQWRIPAEAITQMVNEAMGRAPADATETAPAAPALSPSNSLDGGPR